MKYFIAQFVVATPHGMGGKLGSGETPPDLSSLHLENCAGFLGECTVQCVLGERVHFIWGILCSISRLLLQFPAAVIEPSAIGERSGLGELTEPAGKLLNGEEGTTDERMIF